MCHLPGAAFTYRRPHGPARLVNHYLRLVVEWLHLTFAAWPSSGMDDVERLPHMPGLVADPVVEFFVFGQRCFHDSAMLGMVFPLVFMMLKIPVAEMKTFDSFVRRMLPWLGASFVKVDS